MISLTLSYPPSANRLWRNVQGRTIKSAAYRAWLKLNTARQFGTALGTVNGPYRLTLLATAPDKRRRDLGNLEKACSDLLQDIGAVADDCNAREIRLAWVDGPPGVAVTIEQLEPIQ